VICCGIREGGEMDGHVHVPLSEDFSFRWVEEGEQHL
jgi:hypothetical protein